MKTRSKRIKIVILSFRIIFILNYYLRFKRFSEFLSLIEKEFNSKKFNQLSHRQILRLLDKLPFQSCLLKSASYLLLSKTPVSLFIGVLKDNGDLLSHAWIVKDGMIVYGRIKDIDRYKKIFEI